MASPTQWTWVWVNSGSWWWTGRPGVLRFMRSQGVRHDWATELNWTESHSWVPCFVVVRPLCSGINVTVKRKTLMLNFLPIWKELILSWRRQWQPTPVLLPGKSHGQRSLVGWSPWGRWVGHDWATSLSVFTFMLWRRKWQPTPVFLHGESQGQQRLVGCRLWGCTESDTTEAT